MTILLWILLLVTTLTALALAAVTRHGVRRLTGAAVGVVGVGLLLLVLGADVLALVWLLTITPLIRFAAEDDERLHAPDGPRLAGGILAVGVFAACFFVSQRLEWHGLSTGNAPAQAADLAGRLLGADAVIPVTLSLSALLLVAGRRGEGAS